jgi:serine/threonine protein kinase/tetratricopeptide (TPR) repeat protein
MPLEKISQFEIIETLGAGGMGVVYKAYDTKLNRNVAVKTLAGAITNNKEYGKRFLLEAKAAAALNHPNITTIYETIEEGNDAYIVMEFIEGEELAEKLSKGKLRITEALDYIIQIAEGLKEAHSKGIVHRDIKSANVMITNAGRLKIMDFGLAKLSGQSAMTQLGTTMGTINYMSPEQARGEEIDRRTDLWALGVILYEMLTGKLPFKADYEQAVIYSILNEKPKSVSEIDRNTLPELNDVVNKLLSKLRDERYANADDLLQDVKIIKHSIETGIPIAQLKSGTGTAEYIDRLRTEKNGYASSKRKRVVTISVVMTLFLLVILLKGSEILRIFGGGLLPGEKHIAVLPFTNIGNDPENRAFVDGLMETLTNKVSDLEQFTEQLWVVPASEVRSGKITSAKEAFNKFGVNLVISGSVEKTANGYRVNLNLVDAGNLRQLGTKKIDDPMTSASFIQDEAIIKVAEMLNLELKPEGLKRLTAGKTVDPKAYELYVKGRGKLLNYDKLENINAALVSFEKAASIDSNFTLAYAGLGEAHLQKYKETKEISSIEKAVNSCNKALSLNESITSVRITLGRIYTEQGKYRDALDEFEKVLLVDPKNSDAYRGKATVYMSMGKTSEAELSYKEAIKMKPDYWSGYGKLGVFYFQQGKYAEAAAQFQQVITLNPNNASGYRNLGAMYSMMNRFDEAVEMYNKSLKLEKDYRTYNNLATIYVDKRQWDKAARAYEEIIKINNSDYRVWGYLAYAYYKTPNERSKADVTNLKAISYAEQQLNINPANQSVLNSLASYYGMKGNLNKTRELLGKIKSLNPTDLDVLITLGENYEEWLNQREEAIKWIRAAVRKGFSVDYLNKRPNLQNLLNDEGLKKTIDSIRSSKK